MKEKRQCTGHRNRKVVCDPNIPNPSSALVSKAATGYVVGRSGRATTAQAKELAHVRPLMVNSLESGLRAEACADVRKRQKSMRVYLRLVGYLLRYKTRLACVVVLSTLLAVTSGFQLGTLLPIAEVMFNKDFDAAKFVQKYAGIDQPQQVAAPDISTEGHDATQYADVRSARARLREWTSRFWATDTGQRLVTFLTEEVFSDRHRAVIYVGSFAIIITVLSGAFRFLQQYNSRYIATRLTIDIRNTMYKRTICYSLSFFDRVRVGETLSRFTNDVNMVNAGAVALFSSAVTHPLRILVGLGWAFLIDPKLAMLGLILFPVAGFTLAYFGHRIRRATRRALRRQASIVSLLNETFGGIRIVKAFAMEPYEIERFEKENSRLFRYFMKIAVADELVKPLMEVLGVVVTVTFFMLGCKRVLDGVMDAGQFVLFFGALIYIYDPVKKLSKVFTNIQKGIASGKRVFEIIDCDERIKERPDAVDLPPFSSSIVFRDVSFSYRDGEDVLKDINLEVRKGEMVAFVGASGVGKTSLVNLVPRFYDVTSGAVSIDGIDLRDVALRSLRKQIAVVTQDVVLFNDTVRKNIAYGQTECGQEQIRAAARAADADTFVNELPNGYDTVVAERGQSLSGGQRQRLAIARAIAKDPTILILDEATSSLDSESEQAIQYALDEFVKGRTTLVIAHRLSTVLRADKIVVLDAGRIVDMGSHDELMATSNTYRRLYEAQFRDMDVQPPDQEAES